MMKFSNLHTYCFPLLASRLPIGLYPVMAVIAHCWKWAQSAFPWHTITGPASVDNFYAVISFADAYLLSSVSTMRNPVSTLKIPENVQNLSTIRMLHNGRYVK